MAGYSVTYRVVDEATAQIERINRRIDQTRGPLQNTSESMSRFTDTRGLRSLNSGLTGLGRTAQETVSSLTSILPPLATITGAFSVSGMVALAKATGDWFSAISGNARTLNTSTNQLEALQGAYQQIGGSADGMTEALKKLQQSFWDVYTGNGNAGQLAADMQKYGINTRDATGHVRDAVPALGDIVDKLAAIPNAQDRARVATDLGGPALAQMVEKYRAAGTSVDETVRAYRDAFGPMSQEHLDALDRWNKAYNATETAFGRLGRDLGATLAEDFAPLLEWINTFVRNHEPQLVEARIPRLHHRDGHVAAPGQCLPARAGLLSHRLHLRSYLE